MITFLLKPVQTALLVGSTLGALHSQNLFINGDLEGNNPTNCATDVSAASSLPPSWTNVPAADLACTSTDPGVSDTPDLFCANGGGGFFSNKANPQNGVYGLSGLIGTYQVTAFNPTLSTYHEGIQQTVSGLTIGTVYTIDFYQAVKGQDNALDKSGSWSVYADNTLLGTSAPTSVAFLSPLYTALTWEQRSIVFTATATSHTFKFLPTDDDADDRMTSTFSLGGTPPSFPNGSLRMAIDNISLVIGGTLPLPVEMSAFTGKTTEVGHQLYWTTETEEDNESFVIEHSLDGIEWAKIGQIAGQGTSYTSNSYTFGHSVPFNGANYYRLKQKAYSGDLSYSKTIVLNSIKLDTEKRYNIYPNPTNDFIHIVDSEHNNIEAIELLDLTGRRMNCTITSTGAHNTINTSALSAGIYTLQFFVGNTRHQERIVIQ